MAVDEASQGRPLALVGTFAALSAIYFICLIVHRSYFDSRSHIPGPYINALSRIPYIRHLLAGTTVENVSKLHAKYGEVVSFISGETAWQDIYGFRTGKHKGHLNMQKDPIWYPKPINGVPSLQLSDDPTHSDQRRILAHAFSEKALSEQEQLIQNYVDQLVDGLKGAAPKGVVDMVKWYNWTTFDVIADLIFGEPFGCLQNFATHKYITLLFQALSSTHFFYCFSYFPVLKYMGGLIVDKDLITKRKEFLAWVSSQVQKRLDRETDRPDFVTHIVKHNGEKGASMSKAQLDSNASLMLMAGSETTATLLCGLTYLLLMNPDKLEKLKGEVRSRWKDYREITIAEVSNAPYLHACLNEALRYFPPVPTGFERRTGPGGEVVSGIFVPEGTAVSVSQFPANHSERNFKNPDLFVPERWMGDPEYAHDKRSVSQPFSFGPRNCLGKNLAYAELRLIVAKMIWTFELEAGAHVSDWMERCRVFTLWEKPELLVRVTEVVR